MSSAASGVRQEVAAGGDADVDDHHHDDRAKSETATTVINDIGWYSTSDREALLDRYPVTEDELQRLMLLPPVLSGWYPPSEPHVSEIIPDHAFPEHAHQEHERQKQIIQYLLPELTDILQAEIKDTFVVGIDSQQNHSLYHQAQIVEAASNLCGRRRRERRYGLSLGDRIFQILCTERKDMACTKQLCSLLGRLAQAAYRLEDAKADEPLPLDVSLRIGPLVPLSSTAILNTTTTPLTSTTATYLGKAGWDAWLESTGKNVTLLLELVFHHLLLGPPAENLRFPWVRVTPTSRLWKHPLERLPLQLSIMGLGGAWPKQLYSSEEHGLAFEIFAEALLSFAGPTLSLIRTTNGEILGFYTELVWKKGPKWYTSSDDCCMSSLFRLAPLWNVYTLRDADIENTLWNKTRSYHQYLYQPTSSSCGRGTLTGLAIGGLAIDTPRLHITTTLERCQAGSLDHTFQPGPLLDGDKMFFDIDAIEVWAIRSENFRAAVKGGQLNASVRESARQKAAKVDNRQFLEDFTSGAFANKIFQHRERACRLMEFGAELE